VSYLDPSLFLVVRHTTPDKIKWYKRLRRQWEQDIEKQVRDNILQIRVLLKNGYSGLTNRTLHFSQRKPRCNIVPKNVLR
jgi:hypothetical protein